MKEARMRRRAVLLLAAVTAAGMLSPQVSAIAGLPDALVMQIGGVASMEAALPLSAEVSDEAVVAGVDREEGASLRLTAGEETGTAEVVLRLLGVVPVKTVKVTVEQPRRLVPGGRSLGVALETQGLMVVGSSDLGTTQSPARCAGVRPGDVILSVDGEPVEDAESLSERLVEGQCVEIEVNRDGERLTFRTTPSTDPRDRRAKLGIWVRESTAGVGTLTYYDPETGSFGALGHAITDVDTGVVFPVGEGAVYENEVVQITRGAEGRPGELTGAFFEQDTVLGEIDRNTEFGIFGQAEMSLTDGGLYADGLPVGTRRDIHTGPAQLLTTIDGEDVRAYDCEIEKLYGQNQPETRSMVVHVTDPELLARTGGIVQGMSGSPILQDGNIVGAVTHVFVSDPTRGYGVYIEWMLDAAA